MYTDKNVHKLLMTIYHAWLVVNKPAPSVISHLQVGEPCMNEMSKNHADVQGDIKLQTKLISPTIFLRRKRAFVWKDMKLS